MASRDEFKPDGPIGFKRVEEIFNTTAVVCHVHVAGKVIRTTGEHPFWVRGKGWVGASALQAGDLLASHDGQWVAVEEVFDTGTTEVLYNCRVADYHTYFVGGVDWGFSVWAHNRCNLLAWSKLVIDWGHILSKHAIGWTKAGGTVFGNLGQGEIYRILKEAYQNAKLLKNQPPHQNLWANSGSGKAPRR